jgi:hypothetical protein
MDHNERRALGVDLTDVSLDFHELLSLPFEMRLATAKKITD